ncbi:HEAT repeat domain-containing protein [Paenibacillus terrae]|uniref:HEAT repeat domain-containing protein n=1 Tax=Paenibacillus terrae TaxID=159743 RepID=A0A0D7WTS7_9BACL|nr:hypothetical protein [Paenibacillus terrae]KJD42565.1 hypothetical protein QD47_27510 [Paenibacillus terrae]
MLKETLIDLLDRDEPDYKAAADMGPQIFPYLLDITKNGGERLAPRAVYTASLIQSDKVTDVLNVLKEGASSSIPEVRVATAAAFNNQQHLGDSNSDTLKFLLNDNDMGVRKMALTSISKDEFHANDSVRSEVKKLTTTENNELRIFATEVYNKIKH